jgi:2-isopropylmalate synthase
MIKSRQTYEIMTPEMVGVPETQLVLGKHSGRAALSRRYREIGYELTGEDLDRTYKLFKLLADRKKTILDEDLVAILHHGTMEDVPPTYRIQELQVVCGKMQAEARLVLNEDGGPPHEAAATGDGPIAAALAAVDQLVPFKADLEELNILSATPGQDAVGEVTVRVKVGGKTFTGRSGSTDVVYGAVRAYLHALDKASHERNLEAKALEKASYLWGV